MFPHHECEIAQNTALEKHRVVKYWMHNNMITIGGQKMGKSLGNFITLDEFFTGSHQMLTQAYSPMTIRFFILQAHYRSTVDFSNEALQASEKGLERLLEAYDRIEKIPVSEISCVENIMQLRQKCYDAMNDDLNSAMVIAILSEAATAINSACAGNVTLTGEDKKELREVFDIFLFDILGIRSQSSVTGNNEAFAKAVDMLLDIRQKAKDNKDWATSDYIRNELTKAGFDIKDGKDGAEWRLK